MSRAARFATHGGLLLLFVALTVVMLWPLATSGVFVPDSDDAYFSVWRLAWVAHQLPGDPAHLFDANIFFPDRNTLAYSDAMLLVGAAGAPLFWVGFEPARVHNILLVLAFAGSMYTAFLLARRLTGDWRASLLAAVVFGLCPYRFAHIGHLELQTVLWMPLALLSLHDLMAAPSWRPALVLGLALTAQTFCSIYYGVFLAIYVAAAFVMLLLRNADRVKIVRVAVVALVPLVLAIVVYGPPYLESRRVMGAREAAEIDRFSATPGDYLRVSPQNRVHRVLGLAASDDEHSLFPGITVLLLVAAAFRRPVSRETWLYAILALIAFDASLGSHGVMFAALGRVVPMLTSLRASARFAILVVMALAMLAAMAAARIGRQWRFGGALTLVATLLVVIEGDALPLALRPATTTPSEVDRFLSTLRPDAAVVMLPLPRPEALWLYETTYQLQSINHWRPLVNGYSGFVPEQYERTLHEMAGFPDAKSAARLRQIGVAVVVVNRARYGAEAYQALGSALLSSPDFVNPRRVGSGAEEALVVEISK